MFEKLTRPALFAISALALLIVPISSATAQIQQDEDIQTDTQQQEENYYLQDHGDYNENGVPDDQENMGQREAEQDRSTGTMQQQERSTDRGVMREERRTVREETRTETETDTQTGAFEEESELPDTAGALPLLALLGGFSIAGAACARVIGRAKDR
jgi:hypothetical protein